MKCEGRGKKWSFGELSSACSFLATITGITLGDTPSVSVDFGADPINRPAGNRLETIDTIIPLSGFCVEVGLELSDPVNFFGTVAPYDKCIVLLLNNQLIVTSLVVEDLFDAKPLPVVPGLNNFVLIGGMVSNSAPFGWIKPYYNQKVIEIGEHKYTKNMLINNGLGTVATEKSASTSLFICNSNGSAKIYRPYQIPSMAGKNLDMAPFTVTNSKHSFQIDEFGCRVIVVISDTLGEGDVLTGMQISVTYMSPIDFGKNSSSDPRNTVFDHPGVYRSHTGEYCTDDGVVTVIQGSPPAVLTFAPVFDNTLKTVSYRRFTSSVLPDITYTQGVTFSGSQLMNYSGDTAPGTPVGYGTPNTDTTEVRSTSKRKYISDIYNNNILFLEYKKSSYTETMSATASVRSSEWYGGKGYGNIGGINISCLYNGIEYQLADCNSNFTVNQTLEGYKGSWEETGSEETASIILSDLKNGIVLFSVTKVETYLNGEYDDEVPSETVNRTVTTTDYLYIFLKGQVYLLDSVGNTINDNVGDHPSRFSNEGVCDQDAGAVVDTYWVHDPESPGSIPFVETTCDRDTSTSVDFTVPGLISGYVASLWADEPYLSPEYSIAYSDHGDLPGGSITKYEWATNIAYRAPIIYAQKSQEGDIMFLQILNIARCFKEDSLELNAPYKILITGNEILIGDAVDVRLGLGGQDNVYMNFNFF